MAVLPTDYTDSVTPTGATTEFPATTARGLNATHTQINTNTTAIETSSGLTTTATAAGTTTLTVASNQVQEFTGSTTQTVVLPTTSITAGALYRVMNNSTKPVTVQASGGTVIVVMNANSNARFTARVNTPTASTDWECLYFANVAAIVPPVQGAVNGGETYTIASGTVTQIAGTSISGGSFSPAIGDRILICAAPASTGVGSLNSSQPGNGVYIVTGNTTNLTVVRAPDMSPISGSPAGLSVYNESTATSYTQSLMTVTTPVSTSTAFTWGTTAVKFTQSGGVQASWDNINIGSYYRMWNGSGWLTVQPVGGGSTATVSFPNTTGTLLHTGGAVPAANLPNGLTNTATATQSQTVVSATAYYITNSNLNLPATLKGGMVVGSVFRWTIAMAKTAAGTGSFEIIIYRGTNGTTADTADVAQSIGTQTAVVDSMTLDIEMVVTTTGATGAYYWSIIPTSKAATATGFGVATGPTGQFSGTKSSVAMNTASLKFGIGFRATTGTPTVTIPLVRATTQNIS